MKKCAAVAVMAFVSAAAPPPARNAPPTWGTILRASMARLCHGRAGSFIVAFSSSIDGTICVSMKNLVLASNSSGAIPLILLLRSAAYRSIERRKPRSKGALASLNSIMSSGRSSGVGGSAMRVHSMAKIPARSFALSFGAAFNIPGSVRPGISFNNGIPVLPEWIMARAK